MITHTRFFYVALAYLAFFVLWMLKTPVDFLAWLLRGVDRFLDKKINQVLGE